MTSQRIRPTTLLLAFIALTSVTGQTFQYSRGWTNGKRDGHKRLDADVREMANNLEKSLNPCQLSRLRAVLEGKLGNERLFAPCDYVEDDTDSQPKRHYKTDHGQDQLIEAFL